MWHYFVPESSIHVWLMMCFLIFCNQRPNTKHIFQFTEGVVGKLESKNMENTDKNSIFVSKTWGKQHGFAPKTMKNHEKHININILTSKLWTMWVCAFGKFKKNQTCHSFSFKLWETTCKKSWKSQFWLHNYLCKICGRITIILLNTFFDMERFVVVNHRWQSKNTDGSTGVSAPSIYLSGCLFEYWRTD